MICSIMESDEGLIEILTAAQKQDREEKKRARKAAEAEAKAKATARCVFVPCIYV